MHVPLEAADLSHVFRICPTKELMGLMSRINMESLIRGRLVKLALSNESTEIVFVLPKQFTEAKYFEVRGNFIGIKSSFLTLYNKS